MLHVLDLFSGIGGISLGLERTGGFVTVAFCEIDPFCRKVLAKHWPSVPIFEDVRTLDATGLGTIDVITGGYPCQPFSQAGKRLGAEDDRYLWPAMFEVIKAVRPTWVIGENVAGHISMGLDEVLSDLESEGYTTRPFVVGAVAVDAPHRRLRVWVMANNQGDGCAEDGFHTNSKRPHREEIKQHRKGEPVDGQERVIGQVREVLAGSGDTGQCNTEDVGHADSKRKQQPEGMQSNKRRRAGNTSEDVATADGSRPQGRDGKELPERGPERIAGQGGSPLANTKQSRLQGRGGKGGSGARGASIKPSGGSMWLPESPVGGMVDGIPPQLHGGGLDGNEMDGWAPEPEGIPRVAIGVKNRVDRLRSLGNAVVPQIPEIIGRAILQAEGIIP